MQLAVCDKLIDLVRLLNAPWPKDHRRSAKRRLQHSHLARCAEGLRRVVQLLLPQQCGRSGQLWQLPAGSVPAGSWS